MRRYAHGDSSDSGLSSSELARGAAAVPFEDDRDSSDSGDRGDQRGPITPDTQIIRQLNVLRREMVHNFRVLHSGLRHTNRRFDEQRADTNTRFDEQRADTNRRFDEQRADTNRRFDETNGRFDELQRQLTQLKAQQENMKAQQANRGASHINNAIQPVGRDDGTPIPTVLSDRYKYVHEFLRLKRRDRWPALAALLRFYGSESWPTWGLISMSPGGDSDEEEPLVMHQTLEMAIDWAPEIALQDLARYIGLDYDKITINVEEYERLRQRRTDYSKRAIVVETASSKREKLQAPERQRAHLPQTDNTKRSASDNGPSEILGWDTRATEDRTPESQRPRFRDAIRRPPPTLSPTSVATSDGQLPTRTKP